MKRTAVVTAALVLFVRVLLSSATAQDPNLAPDNLKVSKEVFDKNHMIADVALETGPDTVVRFHYDKYPDIRRITTDDGATYVQKKGKSWVKSSDWGKTGKAVKSAKAGELDSQAGLAEIVFADAPSHDASQGGTVWKPIEQKKENDLEYFTYERSREKPHPDGIYPRYRFIKYKNDTDGKLLIEHFWAQIHSGDKLIPIEIKYGLMILMPANSIIITTPPPAKKE